MKQTTELGAALSSLPVGDMSGTMDYPVFVH